MHVLRIEGREPIGAGTAETLVDQAIQELAAAGDSLDPIQERSLRVLGSAVTSSGKVVLIEAMTMLDGRE